MMTSRRGSALLAGPDPVGGFGRFCPPDDRRRVGLRNDGKEGLGFFQQSAGVKSVVGPAGAVRLGELVGSLLELGDGRDEGAGNTGIAFAVAGFLDDDQL